MSTITVLVIEPDGGYETRDIPPTLDAFQGIVGGYIEPIYGQRQGWMAYVNEEGLLLDLPVNGVATWLARCLGWNGAGLLRGDVMVLGHDGRDTEVSVLPSVVDFMQRNVDAINKAEVDTGVDA